MPTAVSEFYEPLRLILGDNDVSGVFQYRDEVLLSAVKTVFRFGRSPDGFSLAGAAIEPALPDGNAFAKISYEAALLLLGGEEGGFSYHTRALSVTRRGDRKRDLLGELRQKIYEIESEEGFATYQTFCSWLNSLASIGDMISVESAGSLGKVSVGGNVIGLTGD